MAVAAWRVWRRAHFAATRDALAVFALQLGLNVAWSFLFFGLRQIGLALVEVVVLLIVIGANAALFWRIDRIAGALFVPYVLWVAYATVLNAALWMLNRS
jgi:tryptophan-rich sensory protein